MKLPKSVYNWVSLIGAILAGLSLLLIIFLFIISIVFDKGSSYIGLFIYIVLPGLLVIGLVLIPIGMMVKFKRLMRLPQEEAKNYPFIDLNDRRHRNAFIIFTAFTILFLFLTSIGSYEAFHYSESVEFCGKLCHSVMEPEYTAYQHSSHARVACVECHVGPGADWYVRSKLSGLYQVYAVTFNKYPRPIPTPLVNLRPARETCEKCHWPQKFYSRQMRVQKNFLTDSLNSEWDIYLQMKIGPLYSALGLTEGIHWHINPNVRIEYFSPDANRETIPWVRYTNLKTGEVTIYQDEENPLPDSIRKNMTSRPMDCIDCHNRPSHSYKSPPVFVDNALISGSIPSDIPKIKYIAMQTLKDPFSTRDSALTYIHDNITKFYQEQFPDYYKANTEKINSAIAGIQESFGFNSFPFMKVRYDAYPDHIGHLESNGCFRCHSGTHKSDKGRVISKDCNLCHTIVGQGKPGSMAMVSMRDTLEFQHPVDIKGAWKTSFCSECHKYLFQ